jgi:hypothetical protein
MGNLTDQIQERVKKGKEILLMSKSACYNRWTRGKYWVCEAALSLQMIQYLPQIGSGWTGAALAKTLNNSTHFFFQPFRYFKEKDRERERERENFSTMKPRKTISRGALRFCRRLFLTGDRRS